MILYLDTSDLVKLYVEERNSELLIFSCSDIRLKKAAISEGLEIYT